MLLSVLAQLKNVPEDYSCTYLRRAMAGFFVDNVDQIYVRTILT